MPRYNIDDLDSSEQYDNDGCMSDLERFERRNRMLEEEERFNAEADDEDSLESLMALDTDFVFDDDEYDAEFEDEEDEEDDDE